MSAYLDWNTNLSSNAIVPLPPNVLDLNEHRQSASKAVSVGWKERVYEALVASQSNNPECNERSAMRAKEFIRDLPFDIDSPTLSVEDNGNILIEWYKKPRGKEATIFSVILGSDNYIFSLLQEGFPGAHGALNYSPESLHMILAPLKKNFGIVSHARFEA